MAKVKLTVSEVSKGMGIPTPFALARKTGLNYAICYRLWHEQSTRISLLTLARLCQRLGTCPGDLLRYSETKRTKGRKSRSGS
jgi:DNA-binding Xre family transcriptional regulator